MVDHRIVHGNCVFPCFYYFLTISNKVFFFDLGKKNRENKIKNNKIFLDFSLSCLHFIKGWPLFSCRLQKGCWILLRYDVMHKNQPN